MSEQKRLDRTELREKIHNILSDYAYVREQAFAEGQKATATPYINQLLALFDTELEVACKEGYEEVRANLQSPEVRAIVEKELEVVRHEAEERIIGIIKEHTLKSVSARDGILELS